MVFSDFHFYSETLQTQTAVYVLMPAEKVLKQSRKPLPVLYLLHGLNGDHTMWLRQTCIEQFAQEYRVCVVMPAVNRSFYMDMAHGAKYDTFIAEELPRVIETYFPVGKKREHRFAAGISMGGYGAFKLGLTRPNRYAAVASLSGALAMETLFQRRDAIGEMQIEELQNIFGDEKTLLNGKGNLTKLAEKLSPDKAPRMFASCGTEDFICWMSERFLDQFQEKFAIHVVMEPGEHTWQLWNKHIAIVLEWLGLEKAEKA